VRELLVATREYFKAKKVARNIRFIFPDGVLISALVPEDKKKDVGAIVKSKALGRIKPEHYALLPGDVEGAGLRLVGGTEAYAWNATVAPSLVRDDDLYVSADLDFPYPDEPPQDDIQAVCEAIDTAAEFLKNHLMDFAAAILPEVQRRGKESEET
jgi:hypothetical protein